LGEELDWPSNVWMGVTVEAEDFVSRVDDLRRTPAAIRFLSCEPLLGSLGPIDLSGIDWVIAGGESGKNHRPVQESWITELRNICVDSGVPFFFKQWGGPTPKSGGRILQGRSWDEYPKALAGK
jgi:protein gp37